MASKRRGRGEGSIYFDEARQLWVSQVSLGRDPVSGKRRRQTVYGASKQEVRQKLLEMQQAAAQFGPPTRMTVKTFLDLWLSHVKPGLRKGTCANYQAAVNKYLAPRLGDLELRDVSALTIARLHQALAGAGASAQRCRYVAARLRQALSYAVQVELLPSNPALRVKLPRGADAEVTPFQMHELTAILDAAKGGDFYALVVLGVDSGARIGELLALEWPDFDAAAGELSITKSLDRLAAGTHPPKTRAGRRRVLLAPETVAALGAHRARLAAGGYAGPLLFPGRTRRGPMVYTNFLARDWYPLLERAGVPRRGVHSLRHTCATLLLQAGVNVKVVSERLGHASVQITLKTYAHVMQTMQADAAARMSTILGQAMAAPLGATYGSTMAAKQEGVA
jgi:integrase